MHNNIKNGLLRYYCLSNSREAFGGKFVALLFE